MKPTVYAHFVGGETIAECQNVVNELAHHHVKSILDYSAEGVQDTAGMQAALHETLRSINQAAADPNIPFAVFKPTAFARTGILKKVSENANLNALEYSEFDEFEQYINLLCKAAYEQNVRLLIDAEDYKYQAAIDLVVEHMMERYNRKRPLICTTLQMYRHDRLGYLEQAHQRATKRGYWLGIKFVRGAYLERERARAQAKGYPSPIHKTKAETDAAFNAALEFGVKNIHNMLIFNGTHNEHSSRYLSELMTAHNIPHNDPRCWFAQLYGMSDHISFNLAEQGYNVAKYLPYGPVKTTLPYLLRRVEENSAMTGQASRELALIAQEQARRKKFKSKARSSQ